MSVDLWGKEKEAFPLMISEQSLIRLSSSRLKVVNQEQKNDFICIPAQQKQTSQHFQQDQCFNQTHKPEANSTTEAARTPG